MNPISVTEFKANCLKILDRVAAGEIDTLTITKRGKPIAVLTPSSQSKEDAIRSLNGFMRGSVTGLENVDLTAPVLDEALDAESGILHR